MRTTGSLLVALLLISHVAFAGGILTNSNQSAQYIRMLSRGASTEIDAVYYNPAGLVHMLDGFTLALSSQTISQTKKIENTFPLLNTSNFEGDVWVPVFPNFYAAYKKDRLAISFGFGPNAGGGTADFEQGLPSFEMPFSKIPAAISQFGQPFGISANAYSADVSFNGSSIYYGAQLGVSYAVTEQFSVAVGARYIMAQNTYEGSITNVMVNPGGQMVPASTFFQSLTQNPQVPESMHPLLQHYATQTTDKYVDAEESGSAITPIVGFNLRPSENLNVAFRYEGPTELELETETAKDDVGMFPDGQVKRNDIPRIYMLGIDYKPVDALTLSGTGTFYFDKEAHWESNTLPRDRQAYVKNDTWELAFGAEYYVTSALAVSAGYNRTEISVEDEFQSGMSHNLSSDTIGLGGRYWLGSRLALDLGFVYSMYEPYTEEAVDGDTGIPYEQTYDRDNWDVAVGLRYRL